MFQDESFNKKKINNFKNFKNFNFNIKINHDNWWKDYRWKTQYEFNKEAAKTSSLLSGKIDKYENLTGEEILPSDPTRIVE